MKKTHLLLGGTLCLGMIGGLTVPTNAATDVTVEIKATDLNNDIGYVEDKDEDGLPDSDMSEFSITVPATLPIVFNADGSNSLPSQWIVANHSEIANISLVKVEMDAKGSGWQLLPASQNIADLKADTKAMKFYIGENKNDLSLVSPGNSAASKGSYSWDNGTFIIPSEAAKSLSFDVERGAFTTAQAESNAFDMLLTFEFVK